MTYKELVFDGSDEFEVVKTIKSEGRIILHVKSTQERKACPSCGCCSGKVHSYYERKILDLPMLGNETWIKLVARKFYCVNACCNKRVFTERFSKHFLTRKTRTNRVTEKLLKVALLMGGNGGEKICRLMHMPVTGSTLLRLLHKEPVIQNPIPKVLGIDDWAFKKRFQYGTVLVDLERNKIIDLLPDRETASVEQWLKTHPGVEIVTRDRYSNFANGIRQASSSIIQVADRWHVLKNMGDAMQKTLDRNMVSLKAARDQEILQAQKRYAIDQEVIEDPAELEEGVLSKRFKHVKQLLSEGHSLSKIARLTKVDRKTIRKWNSFEVLPAKRVCNQTNMHRFEELIKKMLAEDPQVETKEIWLRITAMGYNGSKTVLYENVCRMRGKRPKEYVPRLASVFWLPSKTSILFYTDSHRRSAKERQLIDDLCTRSAEIRDAAKLIQEFKSMVEERNGSLLHHWIERASVSGIKEFKGFARGLLSDLDAVRNGINLPWSNGPVEGQVNKLKTIKRQMYGRASFALLRKRLINQQFINDHQT